MKKIFLAILTLLYISASIGITIHTEYCGKVLLANVIPGHCNSKTCDKCNGNINKKDNLCCRNEIKIVKTNIDQNIPETVFKLTHSTAVALPPYFLETAFNKLSSIKEVNAINHAPPLFKRGVAIYIRNHVFLL